MWVHVFKQKLMWRLCQMLLWVPPDLVVIVAFHGILHFYAFPLIVSASLMYTSLCASYLKCLLEEPSVHWVYCLQLVCICGWLSCLWMLFARVLVFSPFHVFLVNITAFEFLLQGVTAVLNFQSGIEAENWGINSNSINESCQRSNILMINYPIR